MSRIDSFNDYSRAVSRSEEYLQVYGQHSCSDWEDRSHQDLEEAYLRVQPHLKAVSKRRLFYHLPGNLNPFEASNYHDALIQVLNPPERWFRQLHILSSPEYLALKKEVENEGLLVTKGTSALANQSNSKQKQKPARSYSRDRSHGDEVYSADATTLLAFLVTHHRCRSDALKFPTDSGELQSRRNQYEKYD